MAEQKWPQQLWIVRHGQSAGNIARDAAEATGLPMIDIATRDIDTPLSPLGERQAHALGDWFGRMRPEERPNVILCSPYVRARNSAQIVLEAAGIATGEATQVADERLREMESGILDGLTRHGIVQKYPELYAQRAQLGKFYFRPPGGESWCDVILRLRSLLDTICCEYRRERVLIISHQVIVNCFRYLLERMDERQILDIDRAADVPNCSVTSYEFDPARGRQGKLVPRLISFVAPLREAGAPMTADPDVPGLPDST
ncbi:MAG: histidine phosphatase family protein, partial [Noviherbaspirillum sp.]